MSRHRDLERLLTFVDAAVAIALTLLILPLADAAAELDDGASVTHLLDERRGAVLAFLLSFAVIANLWLSQHDVVSRLNRADGVVTRLLLLWTLCIVALPFPTALLAPAGSQATTKLLYIGTIAVSVAALSLLSRHVARRPELCDGDVDGSQAAHGWIATATLALALVLSLAVPALSYWPLLLLVVNDPLISFVTRRRRRG